MKSPIPGFAGWHRGEKRQVYAGGRHPHGHWGLKLHRRPKSQVGKPKTASWDTVCRAPIPTLCREQLWSNAWGPRELLPVRAPSWWKDEGEQDASSTVFIPSWNWRPLAGQKPPASASRTWIRMASPLWYRQLMPKSGVLQMAETSPSGGLV